MVLQAYENLPKVSVGKDVRQNQTTKKLLVEEISWSMPTRNMRQKGRLLDREPIFWIMALACLIALLNF